MRGIWIIAVVIAATGCSGPAAPTTTATTTYAAPYISRVPMKPDCLPAPAEAVEAITATLSPGEQLSDARTIAMPLRVTVIGGNITANGERVSSHDSWIIKDGRAYGLTSDARQRSGDGRDLVKDWPSLNDMMGECVGAG